MYVSFVHFISLHFSSVDHIKVTREVNAITDFQLSDIFYQRESRNRVPPCNKTKSVCIIDLFMCTFLPLQCPLEFTIAYIKTIKSSGSAFWLTD